MLYWLQRRMVDISGSGNLRFQKETFSPGFCLPIVFQLVPGKMVVGKWNGRCLTLKEEVISWCLSAQIVSRGWLTCLRPQRHHTMWEAREKTATSLMILDSWEKVWYFCSFCTVVLLLTWMSGGGAGGPGLWLFSCCNCCCSLYVCAYILWKYRMLIPLVYIQ